MNCFRQHIVMVPFLAQGHIIPLVALAKQIEQQVDSNLAITIATTPLNVQNLQSSLSSTTIRLAKLPFCSSDHGLPPDSENTDVLSRNHHIILYHASQTLQQSLYNLVSDIIEQDGRPPVCIISDIFCGWATEVAKSVGTTHVAFSTGGAYGTAAYISLWLHLPHRSTDSNEFNLPGWPKTRRFQRSQLSPELRAADGSDLWSTFVQRQIKLSLGSNGLLCNTVEEMEPFGLGLLRNITGLPVLAIGPLLPRALLSLSSSHSNISRFHGGKEPGITLESCMEWLDLHPPASVLYISFGSQNTITASRMMELAIGLEASDKPFIWVTRPPVGFDINSQFREEWLPEGFVERISAGKRGLLVHKWAPQLEILSHKSTGAFLSHCGWNSALESLSQGVPIIGWPLATEQGYNTKMMVEEMGVCVELVRGVESTIMREEVERVVSLVMSEKGKGEEMRKKAIEVAEIMRGAVREEGGQKGSSFKALVDIIEAILSKRLK